MDKLIQYGIFTALAIITSIFMGFSVWGKMKITNLPVRYDRKVFVVETFLVAFLMIEAIFGIYIYHLPWFDYIFVALFMFIAVPTITLITRRVYKRDHPNEPTDVKRPTFRESYRAVNGKLIVST